MASLRHFLLSSPTMCKTHIWIRDLIQAIYTKGYSNARQLDQAHFHMKADACAQTPLILLLIFLQMHWSTASSKVKTK